MRLFQHSRKAVLIIAAPAMWVAMSNAYAVGTASGTDINNQATLSYSVQGVGQPDVNSNTATFKVDNRIDLTVSWQDAANIGVASGQTQPTVLEFRVTNTGNTLHDFLLSVQQSATDDFDPSVSIFVESGATPGYQAAEDTATFIDNLAADDGSNTTFATVYVVSSSIPGGLNDGDLGDVVLVAQVADATTSVAIVADDSGSADDPNAVQNVFADGAGVVDAANDGQHSDTGTYQVVEAQVSVTKTAVVIRDPINGDSDPKAVPGAWVRYSVTITNAAGASGSATITTLADALVATTQIDPDLVAGATGVPENAAGNGFRVDHATGRTLAATRYFTTAADADGADHDGVNPGGNVSADWTVLLPVEGATYTAGELKPGESVTLIFNVVIQ